MPQVIQERGLGETLGSALGTGLGQGVQNLLASKLQQMQQSKQAQGLSQLLNISPPQAQQYASLDPAILKEVVKKQMSLPELMAQENFLQQQGLPSGLTKFNPQAQAALIKNLLPQAKEAQIESIISGIEQVPSQIATKAIQKPETKTPEQITEKLPEQVAPLAQAELIKPKKLGYEPAPMAKAARENEPLVKKLEDPKTPNEQKAVLRKEIERREDKFLKQQEKVDAATQKYFDETRTKRRGAEEINLELDKMRQLIDTGKLAGPISGGFLDALKTGVGIPGTSMSVGLDLLGLTSTETQEFKKIQSSLLRNIKEWFGGRITDNEVKRYMDAVPSLNQSDEGKRAVIRDIQLMNKAIIARDDAMQQIIEENGGYRPHNIEQLVEKKAKPELDKIAQDFKDAYISPQQLAKYQRAKQSPLGPITETIRDIGEYLKL